MKTTTQMVMTRMMMMTYMSLLSSQEERGDPINPLGPNHSSQPYQGNVIGFIGRYFHLHDILSAKISIFIIFHLHNRSCAFNSMILNPVLFTSTVTLNIIWSNFLDLDWSWPFARWVPEQVLSKSKTTILGSPANSALIIEERNNDNCADDNNDINRFWSKTIIGERCIKSAQYCWTFIRYLHIMLSIIMMAYKLS